MITSVLVLNAKHSASDLVMFVFAKQKEVLVLNLICSLQTLYQCVFTSSRLSREQNHLSCLSEKKRKFGKPHSQLISIYFVASMRHLTLQHYQRGGLCVLFAVDSCCFKYSEFKVLLHNLSWALFCCWRRTVSPSFSEEMHRPSEVCVGREHKRQI